MIQAKNIFFTTDQFTFDNLFDAPTPIMAVVFTCVVLTGKPKIVDKNKQIELAKSAEAPWYVSNFTIFIPTVFIILYPPIEVPNVIIKEHNIISQKGIDITSEFVIPLDNSNANIKIPINVY